ncbi:MAG: DUF4338 domain-containing protein [Treponema sp.]|jgi:hypothetical protein|nr:DUF4338 domain-containing protein [Treponema sp.]
MRAGIAADEAVRYACAKFHYAGKPPAVYCAAYSIFNDNEEWCGVIVFGSGTTNNTAKTFRIVNGEILELNRVALNGRQGITSRALMLAVRNLKQDFPHVRLLVSFADSEQRHLGILYQAANWIYTGESYTAQFFDKTGKRIHGRVQSDHPGWDLRKKPGKAKYRYYLLLHKNDKPLRARLESLRLPYPKHLLQEALP